MNQLFLNEEIGRKGFRQREIMQTPRLLLADRKRERDDDDVLMKHRENDLMLRQKQEAAYYEGICRDMDEQEELRCRVMDRFDKDELLREARLRLVPNLLGALDEYVEQLNEEILSKGPDDVLEQVWQMCCSKKNSLEALVAALLALRLPHFMILTCVKCCHRELASKLQEILKEIWKYGIEKDVLEALASVKAGSDYENIICRLLKSGNPVHSRVGWILGELWNYPKLPVAAGNFLAAGVQKMKDLANKGVMHVLKKIYEHKRDKMLKQKRGW